MDPLHGVCICRLCLGNGFSLVDIFKQVDMKIVDVLSKHIGEVSFLHYILITFSTKVYRFTKIFHQFSIRR